MKRILVIMALAVLTTSTSLAQYSLESRPLDPAVDPDIDMFFGDWRESIPYNIHGTITARAILTKLKGDLIFPAKRAAVAAAKLEAEAELKDILSAEALRQLEGELNCSLDSDTASAALITKQTGSVPFDAAGEIVVAQGATAADTSNEQVTIAAKSTQALVPSVRGAAKTIQAKGPTPVAPRHKL